MEVGEPCLASGFLKYPWLTSQYLQLWRYCTILLKLCLNKTLRKKTKIKKDRKIKIQGNKTKIKLNKQKIKSQEKKTNLTALRHRNKATIY